MEKSEMTNGKIVLIGGSAGSLEVLIKIVSRLKSIGSIALVMVVHRKNTEDSTLEELIALKTTVAVKAVEDKTLLLPGFIYIAPSDYHLLFEKNGELSLDTSEKVNHSRPSIDVSFESAADVYGKNLIGILLSGANADGTEGLKTIKKLGGTIIVQNPETAEVPFMPNNAIIHSNPNFIMNIDEIIAFIESLYSDT